jgi:hypothetical protein
MAYCTAADVVALTGSPLPTSTIESIIAIADDEIDMELQRAGLSVPAQVPTTIELASLHLSAAKVLERQKIDGTSPERADLGDFSITNKLDEQIKAFKEKAKNYIDDYIRSQLGVDYLCVFSRVRDVTNLGDE